METNNKNNTYFLAGSVILAGLFIAGAVLWNGPRPVQAPNTNEIRLEVNAKNVKTDGDPYIGSENAPITIPFWSDFQCPYCKTFEINTLPQIIRDYVDSGKVKIVMMDYAFLGEDSITDALYSRAVWNLYPDKYFQWRTAMYNAQDAEGDQGFGDAASVGALTATIDGIDAAKVAADIQENAESYRAAIDADKNEAEKTGISATPSFIIGTQIIAGAYPYSTFQSALDALLK